MSACEIIDSDTFLGAENNYNIFCSQKDTLAETDEDKMRLKVIFKKHIKILMFSF